MKYKYRVISVVSDVGEELFSLQYKRGWWPFWITKGTYSTLIYALLRMGEEKKKYGFKGRVTRMG